MANPVYESMTRVERDGVAVRVWRTEADGKRKDTSDLREVIERVLSRGAWWDDQEHPQQLTQELLEELALIPAVAAIEVLDARGNGVVFYPDWN